VLVLTRKTNQRVVIETPGGDIVVTVTAIRTGVCRLGVEAPRGYRILRQELARRDPPPARAGRFPKVANPSGSRGPGGEPIDAA